MSGGPDYPPRAVGAPTTTDTSHSVHPVDFVFTRICMLAPLYALGLVGTVHVRDGAIAMVVVLAGIVWGYFVHANLRWRLGPLEWIFATPGFHHWHHTYGLQRNCNYASMLPWIDRLFGSHYLPNAWPSRYGIPEPIAASLPGQLVQPFQERVFSFDTAAAKRGLRRIFSRNEHSAPLRVDTWTPRPHRAPRIRKPWRRGAPGIGNRTSP